MSKTAVLFLAVFLCGITLKCGEAVGDLIFYIIKQYYAIHKIKKNIKRMKTKTDKVRS